MYGNYYMLRRYIAIIRKRSQNGEDGRTGVYMRGETTSRMMAADRPYGVFYDFYSVSLEYFVYHLL
jgi:hypothetical protein